MLCFDLLLKDYNIDSLANYACTAQRARVACVQIRRPTDATGGSAAQQAQPSFSACLLLIETSITVDPHVSPASFLPQRRIYRGTLTCRVAMWCSSLPFTLHPR